MQGLVQSPKKCFVCVSLFAILNCAFFSGCKQPIDSIQVILERHTKSVKKLPEEDRIRLMPYGAPVLALKAEALLSKDLLTQESARSIAIRANPDIHAAQARLEAAAALIDEARSRYYPTVALAHTSARTIQTPASRNRLASGLQTGQPVPVDINTASLAVTSLLNALRRPLFGPKDIGGDSNPFGENSTSLTVSWTLFDGFIREARILAAKYLHSASEASLEDLERLIVQAVDAAYYQVQLAEEQLRIARADESFGKEQLTETEKLRSAGRATQADVDNFRVRVLAAQADLTAAEGLRETGRVVLGELMGLPRTKLPSDLAFSPLVEESPEDMAVPDADVWLEKAMRNRPDLRQQYGVLESEQENVRVAQGLFSPTVAISGSWGFDRSSTLVYSEDDQSSAGAVELRWELYSGGRREAILRGAEAVRAEAAARFNRLKLAVQSQVQQSVIDLTNAQQQIRLHREIVKTALENRRIVQAGYMAGKETLTRLNETQRDYIEADANLALARIRLRQAWTDLRASANDQRPASNEDTLQNDPLPVD